MKKNERSWTFTSEAVTEGHPDKVCDQISDAILDAILRKDKEARVACEVCVSTGLVMVMGEISTRAYCDIPKVVRRTIEDIGYHKGVEGFNADTCAVLTSIREQSPDIAMGVDLGLEYRDGEAKGQAQLSLGAGDQGMMFGYAGRETPSYLPLPFVLAQKLCQGLARLRKEGGVEILLPDGKAQVTVRYEGERPVHIETVVVSTQHQASASLQEVQELVKERLILPLMPADLFDEQSRILINPTGRFVVGGPTGDSGLTGRKIIVDTYGGFGRHGGGAFSGKDPTKVDRSGAYAARYVAKNLVAAGLAERCEVGLAYAIGVAQPVDVNFNGFGTARYDEALIEELIQEVFDLRPGAIIAAFDLKRPIYQALAAYGHFGREELDLPWERLDQVARLQERMAAMTDEA